jgi:hypothetical protein
MNVLALTSYDMFELATRTSRGPSPPQPLGAIKMAEQEVPSSVAQRIIIKFLTKEGAIPSEIFTRLQAQFWDECLSQPRVFSWAKLFREGRDHVENKPHAWRPRTFVNPDNVLKICELIRANRRITVFDCHRK